MIYDVIIVGAGPVGLMLANLLGMKNIKTLVLEKENQVRKGTRAIGVTPPSLKILKKIKLDNKVIESGVKVKKVVVHGTKKNLGRINFNNLASEYPYILAIPQGITETILEENLKSFSSVFIKKGCEVVNVKKENELYTVVSKNMKSNKNENFISKYLVGCDGNKSIVRNALKINFKGNRYHDTFLMGDFIDESGFGNDAHLFFTKNGPVESFPLPGGKRRWIVETKEYLKEPPDNYIQEEVKRRSGIDISGSKQISVSPFGVQHFLSENYYKGNTIFCGDSAHVMSPIGGQGMNTGFADADLCAACLEMVLCKNKSCSEYFPKYEKYRKKAAKSAAKRAWLSMRIGTMKGTVKSGIRNSFIRPFVLLFKDMITPYFSMLTIPFGTLEKVKKKERKLFE